MNLFWARVTSEDSMGCPDFLFSLSRSFHLHIQPIPPSQDLLWIFNNKHPLTTTQEKTIHGHHQMVNTEIRLIIFSAAKDGEALYSQQKQDQELTVAQIMNSLLPNSDLN